MVAVARSIGGLLGHDRSATSLRRAAHRQLRKLPSVEIVEAEVLDLERADPARRPPSRARWA
jgi:hypothetical protein